VTPHAALGALVVAVHALGFAALAARCRGSELAVEVSAPAASPTLAITGAPPAELAGRIAIDDTGSGPGLHRRRWSVRYRGGIERAVGAVQLVGPFQDPAAPRCAGRAVVGQRLLDDGRAGPGTIAAAMHAQLEAALRGQTVFPVGELLRIERLGLRWARLDHHPEDRALVGDAPTGYVRASATVVFDRVDVPIIVALIPVQAPGELRFRTTARAELAFDNRVVQWLSTTFGGDRLATRLARRQIDDALVTALAPPPPLELPGGPTLRFLYCDEPPEIAEGAYGALPFGIAIARGERDPQILPPRLGRGPRTAPPPGTLLALDLDLDGLNALLHELWRTGFLDRRLADAGLDRRFNSDPTVAELLSLRLAPLRLPLPPVVSVAPGGLRLSAEARVAIHDGATVTDGRLWGGLDFRFTPPSAPSPSAPSPSAPSPSAPSPSAPSPSAPSPSAPSLPHSPSPRLPAGPAAPLASSPPTTTAIDHTAVTLGALELSCERTTTTLVPCFSDLVDAVRGRSSEFHGALTATFVQLLTDIFVGRLAAPGMPAELEIRGVIPSISATAINATLHLELDSALASPR
jgi:hypothetical protein